MRSPAAIEQYHRGIECRRAGRVEEAVGAYQAALAIDPGFPEAENNLGNCFRSLWRLDEAEAAFRRAVALRDGFAAAWNNLGATLKNLGRADEAVSCVERALELEPSNAAFHSNLIYLLHYAPGDDPERIRREERRWNERHAAPLRSEIPPHRPGGDPDRRLRVGYVSAGFREQAQSLFTLPLFRHQSHERFEVFGYSDSAASDEVTEEIRKQMDEWRPIAGWPDAQVARQIRADGIDILVDLLVHSAGNRLTLFARKPAPVQATWLGYPGSTGLDTIDGRLTDPWLDPPGETEGRYTERSWRLPSTFWCYDPLIQGLTPGELPALRAGHVTLGCLNNFSKVNAPLLDLWGRVLRSVPSARLRLLAPPGGARRRVLAQLGGAEARVDFADFLPRRAYLESYREIDLALDPFPCNGHTTSLDAWWMGVPVVSLCGRTAVSRAGLSQAMNLGLPDWVARTPEDYVRIVAALAADLPRLARLRGDLRGGMERSPLMDGAAFARGVEDVLRMMWRRWCDFGSAGA